MQTPLTRNDASSLWPIWSPGAWLVGFITRITKHCYKQNIKNSGPHGFQTEELFYVSLCQVYGSCVEGNLDNKVIIGTIYVGYSLTLLHANY